MSRRAAVVFPLLLLLLSGCASLGLNSGQDLNLGQKLVLVDREFTAVVNTASDMVEAGVLDSEEQRKLDPMIQDGNRALDRAWEAYNMGRKAEAREGLSVSTEMLMQIRMVLKEAQ